MKASRSYRNRFARIASAALALLISAGVVVAPVSTPAVSAETIMPIEVGTPEFHDFKPNFKPDLVITGLKPAYDYPNKRDVIAGWRVENKGLGLAKDTKLEYVIRFKDYEHDQVQEAFTQTGILDLGNLVARTGVAYPNVTCHPKHPWMYCASVYAKVWSVSPDADSSNNASLIKL